MVIFVPCKSSLGRSARAGDETAERAAVAAARLEELGLGALPPALADTAPREAFQELYACWPLRWYFLDGHTLTHIAQPHPGGRYDLNEMKKTKK